MRKFHALVITFNVIAGALVSASPASSQQANCGYWPQGAQRADCYRQQEQIYRQEQQWHEQQYRQQYDMHRNIGPAIRRAPGGQYLAPAWNAPRYYYDYRYGRPY